MYHSFSSSAFAFLHSPHEKHVGSKIFFYVFSKTWSVDL